MFFFNQQLHFHLNLKTLNINALASAFSIGARRPKSPKNIGNVFCIPQNNVL